MKLRSAMAMIGVVKTSYFHFGIEWVCIVPNRDEPIRILSIVFAEAICLIDSTSLVLRCDQVIFRRGAIPFRILAESGHHIIVGLGGGSGFGTGKGIELAHL